MRGEGETAAKAKRRPALMGRFRRNRWNLGCAFLQYGLYLAGARAAGTEPDTGHLCPGACQGLQLPAQPGQQVR